MSDIELESEGSTNMENDHCDYSYDAPVQQYLKYQKGHTVVWTDLHDKQEKIHVLTKRSSMEHAAASTLDAAPAEVGDVSCTKLRGMKSWGFHSGFHVLGPQEVVLLLRFSLGKLRMSHVEFACIKPESQPVEPFQKL